MKFLSRFPHLGRFGSRGPTRQRQMRSPHPTPSFRPRLEALEDRVVPASLIYSTSLNATVYASAVDSQGDVYVTGQAGSGFQTTAGAYQTSGSGAFVAKLNPAGSLVYATYLGNGGTGLGIAADAAGDAYVIGENGNLPTTANAIGSSGSGVDFVAELNPTGAGLLYSTYLPGSEGNGIPLGYSGAIAVDGSGNIEVAGTAGSGFPVTASAFQTTPLGNFSSDAFFAKINATLSGSASVLYATYLGGSSGEDQASGIAVDSAGNAYLTGFTDSTNFPTTNGALQRTLGGGGGDVFVAKVNPTLSGAASLVYSTYLGGSGLDGYQTPTNEGAIDVPQINGGIAVDSAGNAYITSSTSSGNFPTTSGAFQTKSSFGGKSGGYGSPSDAFVTKLNASGTALVYSTYLGNGTKSQSLGNSIAVDANGDAYVTGWTTSTSFPTKNPIQATSSGGGNALVTTFNPSGSGLLFSSYLGSTGGAGGGLGSGPGGGSIGLDSQGNIYDAVTGGPIDKITPVASLPVVPSLSVTRFVHQIDPSLAGSTAIPTRAFTPSGAPASSGLTTTNTGSPQIQKSSGQPSPSQTDQFFTLMGNTPGGSALPGTLSDLLSEWQSLESALLTRFDSLLNMEAGAMGLSRDTLIRDLLFASES